MTPLFNVKMGFAILKACSKWHLPHGSAWQCLKSKVDQELTPTDMSDVAIDVDI